MKVKKNWMLILGLLILFGLSSIFVFRGFIDLSQMSSFLGVCFILLHFIKKDAKNGEIEGGD